MLSQLILHIMNKNEISAAMQKYKMIRIKTFTIR